MAARRSMDLPQLPPHSIPNIIQLPESVLLQRVLISFFICLLAVVVGKNVVSSLDNMRLRFFVMLDF